MSGSTKVLDPAFQGAGQKPGTEIWRIENFEAVPVPKSEHGKFYMGDTYIVLQTTQNKGGAYLFDIHFWIGKDTSQDEAGTAAVKTVELDAVLGGRAVQHREIQGHESDKFLSYFKPCIIPLEGGVASGFKTPEEEVFETRLYTCKGKRAIRLKQVPFARSSLNHDDEKQTVFEIGQKYVERAGSLEGLSPKVPLYKVTEGNEPCFFTTYFSWDSTKAIVQGNSFQKKAALLFGTHHVVEDKSSGGNQGLRQRAEALAALNSAFNSSGSKASYSSQDRSSGSQEGPRQRAEALAALTSAFNSSGPSSKSPPPPRPAGTSQASQRAAAVAALSQVLVAENPKSTDTSPTRRSTSSNPPDENEEADASEEASHETKVEEEVSPAVEEPEAKQEETAEQDDSVIDASGATFTYEQLRAKSENPVTGIDFKQREAYLSEEEFQSVFGMEKEAFNNLPRWKQDLLKRKFDLF
ncbi:hypothetical protein BRARA_E00239 [Brassica rapa]|uniref:HP domain-containing protein n=1 Tax=Brassica campestris TaxID=3711 RepID=A0A397ZFD8_BRACM|nr:hypothetical protein BRARA_E00239 [Brassica rapa]